MKYSQNDRSNNDTKRLRTEIDNSQNEIVSTKAKLRLYEQRQSLMTTDCEEKRVKIEIMSVAFEKEKKKYLELSTRMVRESTENSNEIVTKNAKIKEVRA